MSIRVTVEDSTGKVSGSVALPTENFLLVACRWDEAVEAVAGHLSNEDGTLRLHAARRMADKIIEVLAFKVPYLVEESA